MLETCLKLRREMGDPSSVAATLSLLSSARLQAGDAAGARLDELEALDISGKLGDRLGEVLGLLHLGQIALYESDHQQARSRLQMGLKIACELKHQETEGECELLLGEVALESGDTAQARKHLNRSLTVCREAADKRGEANALWQLGKTDLQAGDSASARVHLTVALKAFRTADMWNELLGCLEDHAILARLESSLDLAVRIAATATVARQRLKLAHSPLAEQHWQERLASLRGALPNEAFAAAWADAADQWEVDDAVQRALSPADAHTAARSA